ncbi:WPE palindromic element domain-containing protein [Wolbachia pipientis]|uniref:WPE palindromic element domain-containing protein n=1 Tax=Wolbachia pipientis TaxID=955 RepID=UPI00217515C9|nr:WPE palindromic element domain-containing protein [Wolbachia pipientis]
MSGHWDDTPLVGIAPKLQRSYSCVLRHWDPEKLIVHYTTFSIKSWMPVSSTGMTPFAVFNKNKCSYSYVSEHWDDNLLTALQTSSLTP